ncbi:hypothetical protein C8R44DRAFT_871688 [Mycena epipterygia]|nr:hypothetical protein C8R44DRAFT_871688 [Mycena epipterygia]
MSSRRSLLTMEGFGSGNEDENHVDESGSEDEEEELSQNDRKAEFAAAHDIPMEDLEAEIFVFLGACLVDGLQLLFRLRLRPGWRTGRLIGSSQRKRAHLRFSSSCFPSGRCHGDVALMAAFRQTALCITAVNCYDSPIAPRLPGFPVIIPGGIKTSPSILAAAWHVSSKA